jgi:hypothetical protein
VLRRSFRRWYLGATLPYAAFLSLAVPFVALDRDGWILSYVWLAAATFVLAVTLVGFAAEARGRWLLMPFLGVFVLAFLSGGPAGFIFFGPSMALLALLMARRSSFA